jgi:hypothetical protein
MPPKTAAFLVAAALPVWMALAGSFSGETSCVTEADLARSPLARFAQAIENGDAETAADFVRIPFERPAPLQPIRTRDAFVARFPTLFDDTFRRVLRGSSFAEDWQDGGWRGVTAEIGALTTLRIDGTLGKGGQLYAIDTPSTAETALRARLLQADRATLPRVWHDTPYEPQGAFLTEDGALAGRIDRLPGSRIGDGDGIEDDMRGDWDDSRALYRVALFEMPLRDGQMPETVFYATRRADGNGGCHTYLDTAWCYSLSVTVHPTEPPPGFELPRYTLTRWLACAPETGKPEYRRPARYMAWSELRTHSPAPAE